MQKILFKLQCIILSLIIISFNLNAEAKAGSPQERSTSITIYKDASLISEKRAVTVNAGYQVHEIDDIPITFVPYTMMLYLSGGHGEELIREYYFKKHSHKKSSKLLFTTQGEEISSVKSLLMHYMCIGITWKSFYTLKLSPKYEEVAVNGWIVVNNKTDVDFSNAKLLFVDGRAPSLNHKEEGGVLNTNLKSYSFEEKVTITKNEAKRLNWISYARLPAKQELRINLDKKYLKDLNSKVVIPEVETWLSFNNKTSGNGLPQGEAVLYYRDDQGSIELLGKAVMNVLEKGKEVSVKIPHTHSDKNARAGNTSNYLIKKISTELDQIEFKKLGEDLTEASYRLTVKNQSDKSLTIRVSINLPRCKEWVIVRENVNHQELGDDNFCWNITINPKKESDLLFRIRIMWMEPFSEIAELSNS